MSKKCKRCNGTEYRADGKCAACSRRTALAFYYRNKEAISVKRKKERDRIKAIVEAYEKGIKL